MSNDGKGNEKRNPFKKYRLLDRIGYGGIHYEENDFTIYGTGSIHYWM